MWCTCVGPVQDEEFVVLLFGVVRTGLRFCHRQHCRLLIVADLSRQIRSDTSVLLLLHLRGVVGHLSASVMQRLAVQILTSNADSVNIQ